MQAAIIQGFAGCIKWGFEIVSSASSGCRASRSLPLGNLCYAQFTAMAVRHLPNIVYELLRISVPTIIDGYRGTGSKEIYDARLIGWSERILRCADVRLNVEGYPLPSDSETFVVMSNHQSYYDIPVMYQTLRRGLRMVAKTELFRVPIWSRAMRESGMIELNRTNRRAAVESLRRAGEQIRNGTNVWIAPEGTRSRSGVLGPFKTGGFHMALEARVRILPVTIDGSGAVMSANTWLMTPGRTVRVAVHEPVDPAAFGRRRREELIRVVRAAIASALPAEMRGDPDAKPSE
jgi:1-acyl-sn-glycerol-3-phosphate acyltransferase